LKAENKEHVVMHHVTSWDKPLEANTEVVLEGAHMLHDFLFA
jgi:hypothetical protein